MSMMFVNAERYHGVVKWLRHNSRSPKAAIAVFSSCMARVVQDERHYPGRVDGGVRELAEATGYSVNSVQAAVRELVKCRALLRLHIREAPYGSGHFLLLNPWVGTYLDGAARDRAHDEAPDLDEVLSFLSDGVSEQVGHELR